MKHNITKKQWMHACQLNSIITIWTWCYILNRQHVTRVARLVLLLEELFFVLYFLSQIGFGYFNQLIWWNFLLFYNNPFKCMQISNFRWYMIGKDKYCNSCQHAVVVKIVQINHNTTQTSPAANKAQTCQGHIWKLYFLWISLDISRKRFPV